VRGCPLRGQPRTPAAGSAGVPRVVAHGIRAAARGYRGGMGLLDGRAGRDAPDGFRVGVGDDGVAVLVLDRAAKRNALTAAMWQSLPEVLADLATVPGVRVLLVTGAGAHFSAGADIDDLHEAYADPGGVHAYHSMNVAAEAALATSPIPTVAVVRGACVGGGCQLAVACDLRIAADTARFGVTPAKLGVVYPAEPTLRLARLVGPARAKYLLYTADLVDAARAVQFGLVEEVVPDAELDDRALALGRTVATRSPQSVGAVKAVIGADDEGRDPAMALAAWQHRADDVREGIEAFRAGRNPRFADVR
jgi:enoyl-CoA hydratase/carnithine racemase